MPAKMHRTEVSDIEVRALAEMVSPMVEPVAVDAGFERPPPDSDVPLAQWRAEQEAKRQLREVEDQKRRDHAASAFKEELLHRLVDAYEAGREDAVSDEARRAVNIRGYVLLGVVAAVVSMPLIGMLLHLDPDTFGAFIAPITGIAGTIVGYWFGTVGQVPGQSTTQRRGKE